jgi:hypothetical protein
MPSPRGLGLLRPLLVPPGAGPFLSPLRLFSSPRSLHSSLGCQSSILPRSHQTGVRAVSGLPLASFMALGWCISTSCKDTVRCLDSCRILAIWFRMVFVAWGPFGWCASCKLGSFNSGLLVTCLSKPPACQLRFRFRCIFSTAGLITLTKLYFARCGELHP